MQELHAISKYDVTIQCVDGIECRANSVFVRSVHKFWIVLTVRNNRLSTISGCDGRSFVRWLFKSIPSIVYRNRFYIYWCGSCGALKNHLSTHSMDISIANYTLVKFMDGARFSMSDKRSNAPNRRVRNGK